MDITLPKVHPMLGDACRDILGAGYENLSDADAAATVAQRQLRKVCEQYCIRMQVSAKVKDSALAADEARNAEDRARDAVLAAEATVRAEVKAAFEVA